MSEDLEKAADAIARRAEESFQAQRRAIHLRTDNVFFWLMLAQWALAVAVSLLVSPLAWEGKASNLHQHVWIAVGFGGLITLLPMALIKLQPGQALTRHVVAAAEMLWSMLMIHLTGGRIESHFTIFMGITFLTFYRDWPVVVTGMAVTASDHVLRGLFWPESLFGAAHAEILRMAEHAGWVSVAGVLMLINIRDSVKDMRATAEGNAQMEALAEGEWRRSSVLDRDSPKSA